MYTVTISRDSWHYKLIRQFISEWDIKQDLCGYLGQLAGVLAILLAGVALTLLITIPLTEFVIWAGVVAISGHFVEPSPLAVTGCTMFLLVVIMLVYHVTTNFLERREDVAGAIAKRIPSHTKQFLAACYESFKSRVCFKLEFKDKISD